MKATGIVRRIDDLGRVVIPKEIRRTLRIRDGDPLEIFTDRDGVVVFKKYSPMGDLTEFAAQLCESVNKATGSTAAVCDRDSVIAAAGSGRRELMDKRISAQLEALMEDRRAVRPEKAIPVTEGESAGMIGTAAPILSEGDVLGCAMFITLPGAPPAGELELKLAQTIASFLGRQMES